MAALAVKHGALLSLAILLFALGGCATSRPAVTYSPPAPRAPVEEVPRGWPLQGGAGELSSRFGVRIHPQTGVRKHHDGVDIRAPQGTPVVATAGGSVTSSGMERGYGLVVKITHGRGLETLYAHLSKSKVTPGIRVRRGTVIGNVGASGNATGSHLHYEIRRAGRPVDPAPFIPVK